MREMSLEFEHILAGSPLRRPVYAALVGVAFLVLLVWGMYDLLWPYFYGATHMIRAFAIGAVFALLVSIPAVLLVLYLDRREPESPLLLAGAAVWGAVVSASLSLVFSNTLYGYMIGVAKQAGGTIVGMSADTFTSVAISPIVEELVKGVALLLLFWLLRSDFDGIRDGLLYGGMVGLGFNAAQYTVFLLDEYARTAVPPYLSLGALQFVFLGVNAHFVYTALLGAGFGLARQTRRPRWKWLGPLGGLTLAILANMLNNSVGTKVINELVRAWTGHRLLLATTPPVLVWVAAAIGTVCALFWAYILLGVLVYRAEKWEVNTIRQQLFPEVNVSVTPDEYVAIEDDAPFRGRRVPGYPSRIARAIMRAQNELAYRKWHVEEEGGKVEEDRLVKAWRAHILELRASAKS